MFANENIFIELERKKRKHYEIRMLKEEEEMPEPERKRMKVLKDLNPLRLSKKNEFQILSPYIIIKDFPKNYKFNQWWTDSEKRIIDLNTVPDQQDVIQGEIDYDFYDDIINFVPEKKRKPNKGINYNSKFWKRIDFSLIEEIILQNKNHITLSKLREEYKAKKGKFISKSSFAKILKYHFKLKWRKITKKNAYLKTKNFLREKFIFLKLLFKLISSHYKIVFIDESCFDFRYKNRKGWDSDHNFYYSANFDYGINLANNQFILATTFSEVLHTKHWKGTNNAETFTAYLEELVDKMRVKNNNDFSYTYFFLDSSKIHEGSGVYNFFKERNLKILFGVNYFSVFDLCEYFFRPIKIEHYKKVYFHQNDFDNFISEQTQRIKDKNFISKINKHYFEALRQEMRYFEENNVDLGFIN